MKTFETEKHNIPEGATHYADETHEDFFAWIKFIGGKQCRIMPSSKLFNTWIVKDTKGIKPIPQTNIETPEEKEVEWANGDIATYEGKQALVIAYHPHHPSVVIELPDNEYLNVLASELSKPETEAERVERERLESGKALHSQASKTEVATEFGIFRLWEMEDKETRDHYCQLAERINYRKESE